MKKESEDDLRNVDPQMIADEVLEELNIVRKLIK